MAVVPSLNLPEYFCAHQGIIKVLQARARRRLCHAIRQYRALMSWLASRISAVTDNIICPLYYLAGAASLASFPRLGEHREFLLAKDNALPATHS